MPELGAWARWPASRWQVTGPPAGSSVQTSERARGAGAFASILPWASHPPRGTLSHPIAREAPFSLPEAAGLGLPDTCPCLHTCPGSAGTWSPGAQGQEWERTTKVRCWHWGEDVPEAWQLGGRGWVCIISRCCVLPGRGSCGSGLYRGAACVGLPGPEAPDPGQAGGGGMATCLTQGTPTT